MAAVTRRQYKGAAVATTITAGINPSDATCSLAATTGWPSTASVPFMVVIEPGTSAEEKCSATISGSTLTLTRAQDDTTAASHGSGSAIYPVFSADEADEANAIASVMTTRGDIIKMASGPTVGRLGIGTSGYALISDGTDPSWGQVANAGVASAAAIDKTKIAGTAVTLADTGTVTSTMIANTTIVQGDLALTLLKLLCPVGTISAYADTAAPTGWILCNGTAVVSGTHPELFAICATTPDLRGRALVGVGTGTGLTARARNDIGGAETVTLNTGNMPTHTHANTLTNNAVTSGAGSAHFHANTLSGNTVPTDTHTHTQVAAFTSTYQGNNGLQYTNGGSVQNQDVYTSGPSATQTVSITNVNESAHTHSVTSNVSITNQSQGSGGSHDNMQPFYALNYIIKHDYV